MFQFLNFLLCIFDTIFFVVAVRVTLTVITF